MNLKITTISKYNLKVFWPFLLLLFFMITLDTISLIRHWHAWLSLPKTPFVFEVITNFHLSILSLIFSLIYIKRYWDVIINSMLKAFDLSLDTLIYEGNFNQKYFKIKKGNIITKRSTQRKVIVFLNDYVVQHSNQEKSLL